MTATESDDDLGKGNDKYIIFQALSHPSRVRILELIEAEELTFSSLKQAMGITSSGQLQHHLQKLSGLIMEKENGNYGLTDLGRKAIKIYRDSESSGKSLEDICCIPAPSDLAREKQVNGSGTALRLAIGLVLLALTAAIAVSYFVSGTIPLAFHLSSSSVVSLGPTGLVLFGFFGISYLISALTGYPGCEVTAIPNLFTKRKKYCSCPISPFNLPNGSFLKRAQSKTA